MIFTRCLIKETLIYTLTITFTILLIFTANQFIHFLGASASGRLFGSAIWGLILIQVPYFIGLLLPLGLYLGIILTQSRWASDHELVVWWTSGISFQQIFYRYLALGTFIALIVAVLNLWVNPYLLQLEDRFLQEAKSSSNIFEAITPGRFIDFANGRSVAYVAQLSSRTQELKDVFLAVKAEGSEENNWDIMVATKGYIHEDEKTNRRYLVTLNGHRYMGQPGSGNYRIIHYGSYAVQSIQPAPQVARKIKEKAMNFQQLLDLGLNQPKVIQEIQWRFALPISTLILVVLALPLSETQKRQGRYAKIVPAILIYIIYANLLLINRDANAFTWLSPWLGFNLVHLGMLALGLYWIWQQQRRFAPTARPNI